ncbi:MAG TPA: preprotein translocase subunit SecE [Syntrophomonadaceae bacterium]|jgi:preprotein translocase subunit SecE|nr:preprotein translocase subunit SecE [Syntrophomonadaceae bacterium]
MAKDSVSPGNTANVKNWFESVRTYFKGVYHELKKVHWPGRVQLIAYTGVVLLSVAIIAVILWVFDSGLSLLLNWLMGRFA